MQLFDVPSEADLNRDNILEKIGVLRLKKLDLIIREAVQSFIDDYGDQMFWLSSRTIASHIHDNMHKCCKKLLSIEDKMRLVTQNNTFKLILDDVNLVLQFKKFNKKSWPAIYLPMHALPLLDKVQHYSQALLNWLLVIA